MLLFAALLTVAWATCPDGYHHDQDSNRCLKAFTQPLNFFNAQLKCSKDGGNLASLPKSGHLQEALPKSGKIFTGLRQTLSGEWKHLDNQPVAASLVSSLPQLKKGSCASYNTETSSYEPSSCEVALPFICSQPVTNLPIRQDSCPPCPNCNCYTACESGWTYFAKTGSCYRTFFGNLNFTTAVSSCHSKGAQMMSIHSDEENEFVIDLASTGKTQSSSGQVWIGLYLNNGQWTNSDGSPLDYTAWTSGSPFGSYNCALLYADWNSSSGYRYGQWDVEYCYRTMRAYVCKKGATYHN